MNLPQKRKHVNDTQEILETIFLEQGITWKPRAFTNFCISKNIHLADDLVVNDRLIYSWISRCKYKAKWDKEEQKDKMNYCLDRNAVNAKTEYPIRLFSRNEEFGENKIDHTYGLIYFPL